MGIVWRSPSIGTAASLFDGLVQVRDPMARGGVRMHWRSIDRVRDAVFETSELSGGEERRARHKVVAAMVGVALQDRADGWRPRLGHELSHHIGGRGGGQGRNVPWGSIRPPQPGQTSMSCPVRSRRRSCQRRGGCGSGGVGAASKPRQSVSLAVRWRLARKPMWRIRWKPSGTVCCRKRRMNSSAGSVMTLVLPSCR